MATTEQKGLPPPQARNEADLPNPPRHNYPQSSDSERGSAMARSTFRYQKGSVLKHEPFCEASLALHVQATFGDHASAGKSHVASGLLQAPLTISIRAFSTNAAHVVPGLPWDCRAVSLNVTEDLQAADPMCWHCVREQAGTGRASCPIRSSLGSPPHLPRCVAQRRTSAWVPTRTTPAAAGG